MHKITAGLFSLTFLKMCKGGLIMDVVNVEQAKIAEEAGVTNYLPNFYIRGGRTVLCIFIV